MEWIRDWVYRVVSPFLTQLKNRLGNIKVLPWNGTSLRFINADGVTTEVLSSLDIGTMVKASEGCINPNPYFLLGDYDYEDFSSRHSIVSDMVSTNSNAMKLVGGTLAAIGTQKLPIAPGREYRAVCDIRLRNNGGEDPDAKEVSYYLGVACYDSDDLQIEPENLPNRGKTKVAIVSVDAVAGDTSITVTGDLSMFSNGSGGGYLRQILIYLEQSNGDLCYVGQNGRVYEHLGYSRYMKYNSGGHYARNSIVDNGDGTLTIPLNTPLPIDLPIGSGVKSARSGSSYNYWISARHQVIDDKWNIHTSPWREYSNDYSYGYGGVARNGTAYVRLLMLPNYGLFTSSGSYLGQVRNEMPTLEAYYGTIALEWRSKR